MGQVFHSFSAHLLSYRNQTRSRRALLVATIPRCHSWATSITCCQRFSGITICVPRIIRPSLVARGPCPYASMHMAVNPSEVDREDGRRSIRSEYVFNTLSLCLLLRPSSLFTACVRLACLADVTHGTWREALAL